jgi:3-phosphoshikimate 1-carboxyvinyltransferase
LFSALRELGYRVESENGNDKLPVIISPKSKVQSPKSERVCKVSIEESSQFASALLLCAKVGNWEVEVVGENAEESPYVAMTLKLMEAFPKNGGTFQIEPDASSGSYFWAAELLGLQRWPSREQSIVIINKSVTDWQLDRNFFCFFPPVKFHKGVELNIEISREKDLADSIMTAIVTASTFLTSLKFTDLGRLRVQETERVVALRTELTKCGAKVVEEGDTLTVWPSPLHGAEIETYNDHRMAMCFAILGLKVPGIKIKNPACVKKTFPNFFQKLAAQPPHGLGATILDVKSGRKLTHEELFAE